MNFMIGIISPLAVIFSSTCFQLVFIKPSHSQAGHYLTVSESSVDAPLQLDKNDIKTAVVSGKSACNLVVTLLLAALFFRSFAGNILCPCKMFLAVSYLDTSSNHESCHIQETRDCWVWRVISVPAVTGSNSQWPGVIAQYAHTWCDLLRDRALCAHVCWLFCKWNSLERKLGTPGACLNYSAFIKYARISCGLTEINSFCFLFLLASSSLTSFSFLYSLWSSEGFILQHFTFYSPEPHYRRSLF